MNDDKRNLEELEQSEELFEEANGYAPNVPMSFNNYELSDEELFEQIYGYAPNLPISFNNYELPNGEEKTGINKSLKIAAVILAAFMAVFAVYMLFFNPSQERLLKSSPLKGAWVYEAEDFVSYYVFTDDGRLLLKTGDVSTVTGYGISAEEKNTFFLYPVGKELDMESVQQFGYQVAKNEDGVKTLEIIMEDAESLVLERGELPQTTVKPAKDFTANEDIVGTWENSQFNLKIIIGKDGYLTLDFAQNIYEAAYQVSENRVDFKYTVSYTDTEPLTDAFFYEVDGDTFTFYFDDPAEGAEGFAFTKVSD